METFRDCKSFTNENNEYDAMLSNLSNGTQLANCDSTFYGSGIKKIPNDFLQNAVNVTTMNNLFRDCTSLKYIPTGFMQNGTSGNCNCSNMFNNCTSITSLPVDLMKNVKATQCQNMFYGCSNIEGTIPSNFLLASRGTITSMYAWFQKCSKITGFENNTWNLSDFSNVYEMDYAFKESGFQSIPATFCYKEFPKLTKLIQCFQTTQITLIPDGLFYSCPLLSNCSSMFESCVSITSLGVDVMYNCPSIVSVGAMFAYCSNLEGRISSSFLYNSTLIRDTVYMFRSCSKIIGIQSGNVFERLTSTAATQDFRNMFINANGFIDDLPSLWTLYPSANQKSNAFGGCYNAKNWYKVPLAWGGTLQRSFLVLDNSTSQPIVGANIQIGSNNYTTDARGVVSISGGSAVASATISALGYKTVTTSSYSSITDVAYHTISLLPIQIITFQVKATDGFSIPGASVVCDGQTIYTDSLGQAQVSVVAGTYPYTVSYETKSSTGSVVVSTNMTQNVVLSLLAYEVVPSENNNIQILTKGAGMMLNIYSSDSSYTIDWGDGLITNSRGNGGQAYSHVYPNSNYYLINIMNCQNITSCMTGDISQLICYWSVGSSKISNLNFYGYTALKQVGSNIFKNDSTKFSFYREFGGCTSLMKIPVGLFNPCISATSMSETFYGCTTLTSIPTELFKYCTMITSMSYTFEGCNKITTIPEDLFKYMSVNNSSYLNRVFYGCSAITSIPTNLFRNNTKITYATDVFNGVSITSIPVDFLRYNTSLTSASGLFQRTKITSIPADLLRYCTNLALVDRMFANCTQLTSIPSGILSYNTGITLIELMFTGCSNVTSAVPTFWIQFSHIPSYDYEECFAGCTKASNYASIPAGWK